MSQDFFHFYYIHQDSKKIMATGSLTFRSLVHQALNCRVCKLQVSFSSFQFPLFLLLSWRWEFHADLVAFYSGLGYSVGKFIEKKWWKYFQSYFIGLAEVLTIFVKQLETVEANKHGLGAKVIEKWKIFFECISIELEQFRIFWDNVTFLMMNILKYTYNINN